MATAWAQPSRGPRPGQVERELRGRRRGCQGSGRRSWPCTSVARAAVFPPNWAVFKSGLRVIFCGCGLRFFWAGF